MNSIAPKAKQALLVLLAVSSLGLTGCLQNFVPGAGPSAASGPDAGSVRSPDQEPRESGVESPPGSSGLAGAGGFLGPDGDACIAVESATATLTLVPFSALGGGDLGKADETLEGLLAKVPDELKSHLAALQQVSANFAADPSNFDAGAWRNEMQAIGSWISEKCTLPK
ncbi:MAG: hypothetical protein L0G87_15600 [Renibacterium salmoninarum]|nr:hypothetical protein [Renibacterium salmoninarum]